MANPQEYKRDVDGTRFQPGGIDTVHPLDQLPPGKYAYLQNVRAYKQSQIIGRSTESTPLVSSLPTPVHSLRLLNDTSPNGPVGGYVRVIGAAGAMYVNAASVATGFDGNPVSLCPFRPNASVEPWMYTGDASMGVTIDTKFLIDGTPTTFGCTGMTKIRSDGLIYKTGVKEPQVIPIVSTENATAPFGPAALQATTFPWSNALGKNASYNYGQSTGTSPFVINVTNATSVTITTLTGSATVNGGTFGPSASSSAWVASGSPGFPGQFIQVGGVTATSASVVIGAFTDASGNVVSLGVPPRFVTSVIDVGGSVGVAIPVPFSAQHFQIGINSAGNAYGANSGSYTMAGIVTTNALPAVTSILGTLSLSYFGDSPNSGPVGSYIWKNPEDPSGSGPTRTITNADGTTTGNSFIFDATFAAGLPGLPGIGTDNLAMLWTTLNPDSVATGSSAIFAAPLTSTYPSNTLFDNFNFCLTGNIYFPAAGNYTFVVTNHDDLNWGIGGGVTLVSAVTSGSGEGGVAQISDFGQTITVVGGYPLLPKEKYTSGNDNHYARCTVVVNVPGAGIYPIEVDFDYWYRSGRIMLINASPMPGGSPTIIPPLPANIRQQVQYRYVYRSSATGAVSNPSPESEAESIPVTANTISSAYSLDPQIDKVDYYRLDSGLDNFTYVATGPNDGLGGTVAGVVYNTPISDALTDTAVIANPLLQFDNYEPFPVIDLPHKGTVDVSGGVITRTAGDFFDVRWLPGTEILIGKPTAIAYTFIARPTSTTTVEIPGVPDGTGLAYEIPEPDLAAQPLPYLWGPTDNAAYMFGVGDKLNPGTLYYCMGNNPDSAPQTNQIPVTSPSEPLMNGVITAGLGMVFSTERRWLIYPTFTTALATVSGVAGSAFSLVLASSDRGLYIPTCVCTDGGGSTFFRAKDGIYLTVFGGGDTFICEDIYNLFPREGVLPQSITVAGFTIHPPDDSSDAKKRAQKLAYANGYLYYDYQDSTSTPRTLVYDTIAKGWSVDVGQFPFTAHALEEGPQTNTVMIGCTDGSVRVLGSGNTETATSVVIPGSQNAGDARAFKRLGDMFIKALVVASNPITVALYANRYALALVGFTPTSLTGTGSLLPYIVDFSDGFGDELIDIGLTLSWNTQSANLLDLWQPTFTMFPEATQDRPTSWDDCGSPGNKFIQGLLLEANSFNVAKVVTVQRSDDRAIFTPNESPVTFIDQTIKALTFTPPFVAHGVRIVTTDGIPWRHGPDNGWRCQWVFQPFPETTVEWQSEFTSHGMPGWQHIREMNIAYISTTALTVTLKFDQWPTITLTIPSSGGVQTKFKTPVPANKFKLISYGVTSTAPFNLFREQCEAKVKPWGSSGPYTIITPFGGPEQLGADV